MAQPLQLEGKVLQPPDEKYDRLLRDLQFARQLVAEKESELVRLRSDYQRLVTAVDYLREQLDPLYTGLRAIFGQIDLVSEGVPRSTPTSGLALQMSNPKWDSWKKRMPGRPAEVIDLLLLHEEMSIKQLMAALKCGDKTAYNIMSRLSSAGLVSNSGGKYRLREI
jgi:hypothetical protein